MFKSKLGRKPNRIGTIQKTYMFFKEDINKALNNGWTPKEVFRLGIYAKENNPNILNRQRETEEKLEKMSRVIDFQAKKIYQLEKKQQ